MKKLSGGILCIFSLLAIIVNLPKSLPASDDSLLLESWRQGVVVHPQGEPEMRMFLWFYEWNLFGAVNRGHHTAAYSMDSDWAAWEKIITNDKTYAVVSRDGVQLELASVEDGVELTLNMENRSGHDWPALASIIPCFNPGPSEHGTRFDYAFKRNRLFADSDSTHTWFAIGRASWRERV